MKKVLIGVIAFVILCVFFPRIMGTLVLLGIVGVLLSDFVMERY